MKKISLGMIVVAMLSSSVLQATEFVIRNITNETDEGYYFVHHRKREFLGDREVKIKVPAHKTTDIGYHSPASENIWRDAYTIWSATLEDKQGNTHARISIMKVKASGKFEITLSNYENNIQSVVERFEFGPLLNVAQGKTEDSYAIDIILAGNNFVGSQLNVVAVEMQK